MFLHQEHHIMQKKVGQIVSHVKTINIYLNTIWMKKMRVGNAILANHGWFKNDIHVIWRSIKKFCGDFWEQDGWSKNVESSSFALDQDHVLHRTWSWGMRGTNKALRVIAIESRSATSHVSILLGMINENDSSFENIAFAKILKPDHQACSLHHVPWRDSHQCSKMMQGIL